MGKGVLSSDLPIYHKASRVCDEFNEIRLGKRGTPCTPPPLARGSVMSNRCAAAAAAAAGEAPKKVSQDYLRRRLPGEGLRTAALTQRIALVWGHPIRPRFTYLEREEQTRLALIFDSDCRGNGLSSRGVGWSCFGRKLKAAQLLPPAEGGGGGGSGGERQVF